MIDNKVYFRASDRGHPVEGYVFAEDIRGCLRHEIRYTHNDRHSNRNNKISFYFHGNVSNIEWYVVRSSNEVRAFINKELPEYLV